jgi:hypothetical protein
MIVDALGGVADRQHRDGAHTGRDRESRFVALASVSRLLARSAFA